MMQSIMTTVEGRHANGEQLPLSPRQRSRPVHQLPVQFVVLAHDRGMDPVHLDDIGGITDAIGDQDLPLRVCNR